MGRRLRRHRRRAIHRAEPLHLLLPHGADNPNPRSRRQPIAGHLGRTWCWHRPGRRLCAGPGDPEPPAGQEHYDPCHDPLLRTESVRPRNPGHRKRQCGIRPGNPIPHVRADNRPAGALQRPLHRREAGAGPGDNRSGACDGSAGEQGDGKSAPGLEGSEGRRPNRPDGTGAGARRSGETQKRTGGKARPDRRSSKAGAHGSSRGSQRRTRGGPTGDQETSPAVQERAAWPPPADAERSGESAGKAREGGDTGSSDQASR